MDLEVSLKNIGDEESPEWELKFTGLAFLTMTAALYFVLGFLGGKSKEIRKSGNIVQSFDLGFCIVSSHSDEHDCWVSVYESNPANLDETYEKLVALKAALEATLHLF